MRDVLAIILRPDALEVLAILAGFALLAPLAWIATDVGLKRREGQRPDRKGATLDAGSPDNDSVVTHREQGSEAA
jgi:hypothetical protein